MERALYAPTFSAEAPSIPGVDDPDVRRAAFAQSVIRGLSDSRRWLSCRYLYDATGSQLFERITSLPEYYLTRAESVILRRHATRLRARTGPCTLAELGAGSATKTRMLLQAWLEQGPTTYAPIDISGEHLSAACAGLRRDFPDLRVRELVGTYEQTLPRLSALSPLCLLFLGSSLGNFNRNETDELLETIAANLSANDHLLLGVDLIKDPADLERAYDDSQGITAAFSLNLFTRMNRELGTQVDLDAVEHIAYYNDAAAQIEIYARFTREQVIALPEHNRTFRLAKGEMVLVEISRKFDLEEMNRTAVQHDFDPVETLTDPDRRFGLLLWRKRKVVRSHSWISAANRNLDAVRAQTLAIVAPLDDRQLRHQHSPLMSPIVWDLGHIANYEEQWVSRALRAGQRVDRNAANNDGLYDAVRHPRVRRAELALLERREALDFLAQTRSHTRETLARVAHRVSGPLVRDGYVFAMLAQHESQHAETILQSIQLLDPLVYEPFWRSNPAAHGRRPATEALVPAGPFLMGTDDRSRAYDNERPLHQVGLSAFFIDILPVTNEQFLRFVEDDGYVRRELWSEEGYQWLQRAEVGHPQQWRRDGNSWAECHFGRRQPLRPEQPVIHVSWYEADAYARWAGKRLPTEAEWEKAAAWDLERGVGRRYPWGDSQPGVEQANLGQSTFAPAAVGSLPGSASYFGCEQMLGDVWEWTASEFLPYPGFAMFPYSEYSRVHFGKGYRVLRGGSWATNPLAIRNTFRNWDLPQRRQIFAGFRCARDA